MHPIGIWEWNVMPTGFASSPGWFQSVINRICEGLETVRIFIDEIVCCSTNGTEHVEHSTELLERLTTYDLMLAPHKARLWVRAHKFLGDRVTAERLAPDPGMVEALI